MKFNTTTTEIRRAMDGLARVSERRNVIPILSNVKVSAADGAITLTTTDMDIEMVSSVPAKVDSPGSTTVPAHTLHDMLRKLNADSSVQFELNPSGEIATIRSGRYRSTLPTIDVSDFPQMSRDVAGDGFAMPAKELARVMERSIFAVSTDETRFYLNGAYFHPDSNGALKCVATDGHRLAVCSTKSPDGCDGFPGVIIPSKTVALIRKLCEGCTQDVSVAISETMIRVSAGDTTITSKVIDGTFPEYDRVIPKSNHIIIEMDMADLLGALGRVSIVTEDRSSAVKLSASTGLVDVSATGSVAGGGASEAIDAKVSEEITFGINGRYLRDVLDHVTGDVVRIHAAAHNIPIIITAPGDDSALFVIMPILVS